MTKTTDSLSDAEQAQLAREIAADSFDCHEDLIEVECGECGERWDVDGVPSGVVRAAVQHGWDAALEYAEKKQSGKTELGQHSPRAGGVR